MIRDQIIDYIRANTDNDKISLMSAEETDAHVFKRPNSLRLSYEGYRLLAKLADSYTFTHEDDFRAKHIIALVVFKYPFYLSKKFFILFSEEDALLLKLHGSDVKMFLEKSNLFRE